MFYFKISFQILVVLSIIIIGEGLKVSSEGSVLKPCCKCHCARTAKSKESLPNCSCKCDKNNYQKSQEYRELGSILDGKRPKFTKNVTIIPDNLPEPECTEMKGPLGRSGHPDPESRWPRLYSVIIDQRFSDNDHAIINNVLVQLQRILPCIDVVVHKIYKPKFHVFITRETTGCYSFVGRQKLSRQPQILNLAPNCMRPGTIMHELIHSLGFHHEISREDREEYVNIIDENIRPEYLPNFGVAEGTITFDLPYDYESVLHYGANAFGFFREDGTKEMTIQPRRTISLLKMGQRKGPSIFDIAKLRMMYKNASNRTACLSSPTNPSDIFREFMGRSFTSKDSVVLDLRKI